MNRVAITSSAILAVGYDQAAKILEIQFSSGAVYRYFGVPPAVRAALLASPSKGRFFQVSIRGVFAYTKM